MNKKAVSLILLSTLSGFILSACSKNDSESSIEASVIEADNLEDKTSLQTSKAIALEDKDANEVGQSTIGTVGSTSPMQIAQAESFLNIYSTTCAKYLPNLDELRDKTKDLPQLTDAQAKQFLNGHSGSAWPVPDDHGTFVLTLLEEKNMCAVYANKANSQVVEKQFSNMFASAPSPLTSNKRDNSKQTTISGEKTTLSYEWAEKGAQRKMLFMLTTDSSADADVQALFTASIIQ
jgi:hypothetical protein